MKIAVLGIDLGKNVCCVVGLDASGAVEVSAAVLRSTPSSTSASASIRRAAALFFSPLAALRSSQAVRSSRVIDTAAPIDAALLKSQHRVRVSLIWESLMSYSFGPLV